MARQGLSQYLGGQDGARPTPRAGHLDPGIHGRGLRPPPGPRGACPTLTSSKGKRSWKMRLMRAPPDSS